MPSPASPELAIECRAVGFAYTGPDGPQPAIEGVTLRVPGGQRLGILGPNGGGKSTLLKLALGLLEPSRGEIRVFGMPPREARRRGVIGYVPQRIEAELAFPISVLQAVEMGAARGVPPWRRLPPARRQAVAESLDLVGASDLADRPIGRLSGGQLQRVMIARALASRPRLLLLDEPTVGVDVVGQKRFADMLASLHQRLGLTIVVVSHDIRTIVAGCDSIACLARTLHSHTGPEGLTPAVLAEVFSHDVAAIFGDVHVHAHPAHACPDPSHAAGGAGASVQLGVPPGPAQSAGGQPARGAGAPR